MKGEVIGMYTSNYSNAGKRTDVGLAVTSDLMKDVVEKLEKSGAIDRGWLGVQVRKTTDQEASADAIEKGSGLVVVKTIDGGPAAGAGIQPGDVIEMVNGKVMRDIVPFAWEIAGQPSGAEVTLDIVHNTSRKDVRVKLAHMPDSPKPSSGTSSTPEATEKGGACLRYVPSVGMTVPTACGDE
jgi:serine protease Do